MTRIFYFISLKQQELLGMYLDWFSGKPTTAVKIKNYLPGNVKWYNYQHVQKWMNKHVHFISNFSTDDNGSSNCLWDIEWDKRTNAYNF